MLSKSARHVCLMIGIATIFLLIAAVRLENSVTIRNLDYWTLISIGEGLDRTRADSFVHGFYPVGYSMLLRLATHLEVDVLRFGQILSVVGGLISLVSLYLSLTFLYEEIYVPFFASAMLLVNVHFLEHATTEGNDLLAASFQVLAVTLLARSILLDRLFNRYAWLIGLCLGFAYLTRYTALVLLPVPFACTVVRKGFTRDSMSIMIKIAVTFLAVTAVQWVPSLVVEGNPFFNHQAKNVWFGIYGDRDWIGNWELVPDSISMVEIIALGPEKVFQNWLKQLVSLVSFSKLWPGLVNGIWMSGLLMWLNFGPRNFAHRACIFLTILLPIVVTALAWLEGRFLLVSLWAQVIILTWVAKTLSNTLSETVRSKVPIALITILILITFSATQIPSLIRWIEVPQLGRVEDVHNVLRLAGLESSGQVVTNDPYLHMIDESDRSRYLQLADFNEMLHANDGYLVGLGTNDIKYLVLDLRHGIGDYSFLVDYLDQNPHLAVPIHVSATQSVYCIMPCSFQTSSSTNFVFENELRLLGTQLNLFGKRASLYLYWLAERPLEGSLAYVIIIKNKHGENVLAIEQLPHQGRYLTSTWMVDTLVSDYVEWQFEESCIDCTISLLVYNLETEVALNGTDIFGNEMPPFITLEQFNHKH